MTQQEKTEVMAEIAFIQSLCQAIQSLDKDVQLYIAKSCLEPPKPVDQEVKTLVNDDEIVTYEEFYRKITDDIKVESHDQTMKLYNLINRLWKLRRY